MHKPAAPLIETHPHRKEFLPFLDNLKDESERGSVLICASFLEGQLKEIISAFLCDIDASEKLIGSGFNAPLGTFQAQIVAAAAMALISKEECRELETIRKIRNEFAHKHWKTFSDDDIIDRCQNLKFAITDSTDQVATARSRFTSAAVVLILSFANRPHYLAQKRLKFEAWPY